MTKRASKIIWLVVALVAVVAGTVWFMVALSGGYGDGGLELGAEYRCEGKCDFKEMTIEEYELAVADGESFVLFVDQGGCTTADRLEGYMRDWMAGKGVWAYEMAFMDVREMPLHEQVKYYPSVVVIVKGEPVGWLRADADEDADAYNKYDAFLQWIDRYVR